MNQFDFFHYFSHKFKNNFNVYKCLLMSSRRYDCEKCVMKKRKDWESEFEAIDCEIANQKQNEEIFHSSQKSRNNLPSIVQKEKEQERATKEATKINEEIKKARQQAKINMATEEKEEESEEEENAADITVSPNEDAEEKPPNRMSNNPGKKPICYFYKTGNCKHGLRGKNCKFEHPIKCWHSNTKKGCNTPNCKYWHPTSCKYKNKCKLEKCQLKHPEKVMPKYKKANPKISQVKDGKSKISTSQNFQKKLIGNLMEILLDLTNNVQR